MQDTMSSINEVIDMMTECVFIRKEETKSSSRRL